MRIFTNFPDALGEIKRELSEMGIAVHTQTYQDQYIADDPMFATVELQNYGYVVTNPKLEDLHPTQPWADKEFEERIGSNILNPGEAYKLRPEIWNEFLEDSGRFAYTYSERISLRSVGHWEGETTQLEQLLTNMQKFPDNRNHVLNIWMPDDLWNVGKHRVPCSLSYHFMYRNSTLFMTYNQRSADFVTHLENDIYLAAKLQAWIADKLGWPVGRFTHTVGSLHAYNKDVEGVF